MVRFPQQNIWHLNRAINLLGEELGREIKGGKRNKLRRAFQEAEESCAKALGQEEAWCFQATERKLGWLSTSNAGRKAWESLCFKPTSVFCGKQRGLGK